jgi:hypothetical protein
MEVSGQLHAPAALPRGKPPPPRYSLDRKLSGPQSRPRRSGGKKVSQHPPRVEPPRTLIVQPIASHYTDWATPTLGMRSAYRILVGKIEGIISHEREKRRWWNNLKMDLLEYKVWGYGLVSSCSGQGLMSGSCEHGNEIFGSIKAKNFLTS